ncbi:serine/threonine-protein kinase [Dactylosporangium sp. CS-047395]|uniref:serine/threonine-protein kinase n=1 Tax=Dactylosporangium sp. CS-047395 TaxID=3239936 RepID=UPI003D909D31
MSVTLVERYRLESPIGAGGMGTVWRATDLTLERAVAVKEVRFPASLSDDERVELTDRAMREARSAAKLDHPHIVAVHDVVVADGRPWIVMRLVEGRSLDQVVRDDGPLTPAAAARVGIALVGALEAAHAAGIVHRDVKPSNVLVQPDGKVLLTDFSIAAAFGTGTLTKTGILLGSPGYIAPERLRTGKAGPEADYFSLGATLYFAVEGRNPFAVADDALAGLFAAATEEHPRPERAGALTAALDGLLAKDPAARLGGEAARSSLLAVAKAPDPKTVAEAVVFSAGRAALAQAADAQEADLAAPAAPAAPAHDRTPEQAPTAGHDLTPDQAPDSVPTAQHDLTPPHDLTPQQPPTAALDPAATVPQDPGSVLDQAPSRTPWLRRPAVLAGSGVLALLIVVGILARPDHEKPKTAQEPPAPTVVTSSAAAASPSPSDVVASASEALAAAAPTTEAVVIDRPADTRTTTKPAAKPTTAAAQPAPPPAPATTGASLSLSSTTYTGYCGPGSAQVTVYVTIKTSTPSPAIRFEMHSTDGFNGSAYTGTASNGSYSTSFGLNVGIGAKPATTDFWFTVTSPTSRSSNRVTFHNNCY